jgi:predicted secreted protein
MQTATITYPDGGVLSGTFFLASYTDTGAYHDATTFQAELQSSGPVSYTAPAQSKPKKEEAPTGGRGLFGFL